MGKKSLFLAAILITGVLGVLATFLIPQVSYDNQQSIAKANQNTTTIQQIQSLALNEIKFIDMNEQLKCSYASESASFVINANDEYQSIFQEIFQNRDCKEFELPEIDFAKYTLLGKQASGSGCTTDFVKKIQRDDENKKIVYSIKVVESGGCEPLPTSMNWVLIPKIPDDYDVSFKVSREKRNRS